MLPVRLPVVLGLLVRLVGWPGPSLPVLTLSMCLGEPSVLPLDGGCGTRCGEAERGSVKVLRGMEEARKREKMLYGRQLVLDRREGAEALSLCLSGGGPSLLRQLRPG